MCVAQAVQDMIFHFSGSSSTLAMSRLKRLSRAGLVELALPHSILSQEISARKRGMVHLLIFLLRQMRHPVLFGTPTMLPPYALGRDC